MAVDNDARNKQKRPLSGQAPKIDPSTLSQVIIDNRDHEINQGHHFYLLRHYNIPTTGNIRTVFLSVGATAARAELELGANGYADIELFEGVTDTLTGLANMPNNRRASANTSETQWETSTSAPTGGASIGDLRLGRAGGTPSSASFGASASQANDILLAPNTQYALVVTSLEDNVDVNFILNIYEHPDDY